MKDKVINDSEEKKIPTDNSSEHVKIRRPFSKLAIELDETDLSSKGVQKMLLAEIDRLETNVARLETFEEKYHKKDKECSTLKVLVQKDKMLEILYSIAIAVGAGLLGLIPSVQGSGMKISLFIVSGALFLFSILAKWKGEKNEG